MHALAVCVVIFTAIPLAPKVILVILILFSLLFYLKQQVGLKEITLRNTSEFGWEISNNSDQFDLVEILPSTVLTRYLIILHYIIQNNLKRKNRSVLIFKDALLKDDFRKLKVELKIEGIKKTDP